MFKASIVAQGTSLFLEYCKIDANKWHYQRYIGSYT